MVWGGDATGAAHASSRSNVDLEIGCLIDLATGLVMFTINGKEMSTSYQVGYGGCDWIHHTLVTPGVVCRLSR